MASLLKVISSLLVLASSAGRANPYATESTATVSYNYEATSKNAGRVSFIVTPPKGLIINAIEEAPWAFDLSNVQGATVKQPKQRRVDLNTSLPGYAVEIENVSQKGWSFDYKLTAFVCTQDKKNCYRNVLRGKAQNNG